MKTLIALLLSTTVATAGPTNDPQAKDDYGPYECAITSVRPSDNLDPIYKIEVFVSTAADKHVTGITPIHHGHSGQTAIRPINVNAVMAKVERLTAGP